MYKLLLILPVGLVALGVLEAADEPKKVDPLKPAAVVKPETRWEYATISTGGRANVHLVTSTEDVSADSWANLAEKLKLTPNGTAYQVAVFDYLGGKGWELATHAATATDNRPANNSYTFKRRAK